MSLRPALLLSLALHLALILAPHWLTAARRPSPTARIEARLLPPAAPAALAEAVSSVAADRPAEPIQRRLAPAPQALRGASLQRAQSALSKHLFYPPQAVALGLEGEVVLLLVLSDGGRLVSASVARSSGHALLDQAALDAARHIGALPGNPHETLFPVRFRLQ